jgi:hypothetical protein
MGKLFNKENLLLLLIIIVIILIIIYIYRYINNSEKFADNSALAAIAGMSGTHTLAIQSLGLNAQQIAAQPLDMDPLIIDDIGTDTVQSNSGTASTVNTKPTPATQSQQDMTDSSEVTTNAKINGKGKASIVISLNGNSLVNPTTSITADNTDGTTSTQQASSASTTQQASLASTTQQASSASTTQQASSASTTQQASSPSTSQQASSASTTQLLSPAQVTQYLSPAPSTLLFSPAPSTLLFSPAPASIKRDNLPVPAPAPITQYNLPVPAPAPITQYNLPVPAPAPITQLNFPIQDRIINTVTENGAATTVRTGFPLDSLSSSAISSLQGLYSLKQLMSRYTGPIVNLRRSTDDLTQDFYADQNGNFWTGSNGIVTSFTDWVNGGTASVAIWYDQSGNMNHAIQINDNSFQPVYNDTFKLIDFSKHLNTMRLSLPDGTFPTDDSAYTITLKHGKIVSTNNNSGIYGSGDPNANVLALAVSTSSGSIGFYRDYWFNTANNSEDCSNGWGWENGVWKWTTICGTKYPNWTDNSLTTSQTLILPGNIITSKYTPGGTNNQKIYINGLLYGQQTPISNRASTPQNNYIGYGDIYTDNYFNGQLYYISIFASPLSDADLAIVESQ